MCESNIIDTRKHCGLIELHCVFQIASLLSDTSSVLNECMETFAQAQDLKTLLGTQKDLSQLGDIGKLRTLIPLSLNVLDAT